MLKEDCSQLNLPQLFQSVVCENITRLAVAREHPNGGQMMLPSSLATAKRAIFLLNMLWECFSKFDSEQYPLSIFVQNIHTSAIASDQKKMTLVLMATNKLRDTSINRTTFILNIKFVKRN